MCFARKRGQGLRGKKEVMGLGTFSNVKKWGKRGFTRQLARGGLMRRHADNVPSEASCGGGISRGWGREKTDHWTEEGGSAEIYELNELECVMKCFLPGKCGTGILRKRKKARVSKNFRKGGS